MRVRRCSVSKTRVGVELVNTKKTGSGVLVGYRRRYVGHSGKRRAIYESWEIWVWVCWGKVGGGGLRDFWKTGSRIMRLQTIIGYAISKKWEGICFQEISRCVWETLQYAPGGNKVQKAIFSLKVKVTRSLTLVSFERASLVDYACQIWRLYLLRFKSYSEG